MTNWYERDNNYALAEDNADNLKQFLSVERDPLTTISGLNLLNNGMGYELYLNDLEFICEFPSVDVFSMLVEHENKLHEKLNSRLSVNNINLLHQLQETSNGHIFQIHDCLFKLTELIDEISGYDSKYEYIENDQQFSFLKIIIKFNQHIHDLRTLLKDINGLPYTFYQNMNLIKELLNICKRILIDRCIADSEQEFTNIIRKIDDTNIEHRTFTELREAVTERNIENYKRVMQKLEMQYEIRSVFKSMVKVI